MTLMFIDDAEKKSIKKILSASKKQSDKSTVEILDKVYGSL